MQKLDEILFALKFCQTINKLLLLFLIFLYSCNNSKHPTLYLILRKTPQDTFRIEFNSNKGIRPYKIDDSNIGLYLDSLDGQFFRTPLVLEKIKSFGINISQITFNGDSVCVIKKRCFDIKIDFKKDTLNYSEVILKCKDYSECKSTDRLFNRNF